MSNLRKVYIGEIEVDFESLKSGDKCLLVDVHRRNFMIEVKSSPIKNKDGELMVHCEVIAVSEKTPH